MKKQTTIFTELSAIEKIERIREIMERVNKGVEFDSDALFNIEEITKEEQ